MAVTFTAERAEDPDTSNVTAYTVGAAFTPNANSLLVLVTLGDDSAASFGVSSVAGGGLTWQRATGLTPVEHDNGTVFLDLDIWYALVGGSPVSTTVVVTYDEAITGNIGWVGEFSGHNTTTPIKQAISFANQAAGVETQSFASPPDSDSMSVAAISVTRNPAGWDATADGWTDDVDTGKTLPGAGLHVSHKAGSDQSYAFTGANGTTSVVMIEIDAGTTTVSPGLITSTMSVFTPTVGQTVFPELVSTTMAVYAPTVTPSFTPPLVSVTMQVFAPTVATTGVYAPLVSTTMQVYAPSFSTTVAPGLVSTTSQVYAPTTSFKVSPGLVSTTCQVFAPVISFKVSPGIVSTTCQVFAPTVSSKVSLGLNSTTMVVNAPTVRTSGVYAGLVSTTSQVFAPTVLIGATVVPGLITNTMSVFAPTVQTVKVYAPLAFTVPQVFAPQVNQAVSPGIVSTVMVVAVPTVTAAAPGATVSPGLVSTTMQTYTPVVTVAVILAVPLVSSEMVLYVPVVIPPTVEVEGPPVYDPSIDRRRKLRRRSMNR